MKKKPQRDKMNNRNNDERVKSPFELKLENYWYHYKWQTIFGVFFLVVIIIATVQLVGNSGYSTNIVFATDVGFTPTQESIIQREVSRALCEDGDEIAINTVDMKADFAYQSQETFYSGLGITTYIYVMSERVFQELNEMGRFAPIGAYVDDAEVEYCTANGVYLKSTDFGKLPALASMPEDSVICLAAKTVITKDKYYDAALEVLEDIFDYTKE